MRASAGETRPGGLADAIDGVVPEVVATPASAEALAALLKEASRAARPTVIRGGGTKTGWGRRPDRVALQINTTALSRLVAHRYGDLIAIVEAGARLADVNEALAEHGQSLPIDSAFPDSTIGGVLATNDCGPLRHRFGTPRDQLIGVTLATADGTLAKAGGEVVKNVAGYDLGKLLTGSHGTLAAIVSATFKLVPRLMTSQTVHVKCADAPEAGAIIARVAASQWEPVAVDLRAESHRPAVDLFIRFASTDEAVGAQVRAVVELLSRTTSAAVDVLGGVPEATIWRAQLEDVWAGQDLVVRCGWLPASPEAIVGVLREIDAKESVRAILIGRAGTGAGHVRLSGEADALVRAVERLRARRPQIDHVVVLRALPEIKARLNVWGSHGGAELAMRALKRAFDPEGIMNAGRGPV
jgi:glycolate oxidase FAD binding subunit